MDQTTTEHSLSHSAPVGAVLVVGGGIAGMQSALDLADQGFKVYLVESQSAIGGKMAQLDKTFPTNDCAMCTISPKLVETARHPNITLLTNTEVQEVHGQPGHFSAVVYQRPRYVDPAKCVACGDCVAVCPISVPDPYNEILQDRRAIYKLYPQAAPNAFAIEKRGIAPCRDACPAGQRAQGYIALIRNGRYEDALRVIKMDNPFPGICGRICNHRCESACNRGLVDEPLNIRALKRFVTDQVYASPRQPRQRTTVNHPERVAIIGAGPCGLTAAQDLALAGYAVTIFEAMPVAGGMLRLGVPEYRLPTEIVEREVQDILDLGVDLRLNSRVDDLDDLFNAGFQAVLIAVGAHEGIRLPIPGADLKGVLINTHFLRDVRLGRYALGRHSDQAPALGQHVLVLGGGNVAIDCARSAVRLGCKVDLACLEGREQMPAHAWEIRAAEEEGVILHPGRSFERIVGDPHGWVSGVECMQVASFQFDENGRLHVEKIPDSLHTLQCDSVIFSVGQRAGLAFIPADAGVGITTKQTIAINPNTMAATRPGVFAAGDSVSGTAFVIEAVESGHRAAESILRYLQGEALERPHPPELPVVRLTQAELDERLVRGEIHRQPRVPLPELPLDERFGNFTEVEGGYDETSAQAEAARCLACGICSECMSCVFVCGREAIDHNDVGKTETLEVGAVILAPGFQVYQAHAAQEYGLGRYPNVVTALQFERLLSASGPTRGHIQRPSDGQVPRRIAFLQCVGSRDQSHDYCSAVCCMYATKEATIAKEHQPELDIQIFLMDMRAFSKGYWAYYERARQRYGIQYTHCRLSALRQNPLTQNLQVAYLDDNGRFCQAEFDLVVLSVGMEVSPEARELARRLNLDVDPHGFCQTRTDQPLATGREGIFAIGPFREPKDIPESVVDASGAAALAAACLAQGRFSLTHELEYPPERLVEGESPRIGVFVCHCGSNIAGYLDVETVAGHARAQPGVVHAECNLYTCSQDSIRHISAVIEEQRLNRVVVASCTPLTHQPLFQDSLRMAGLNPYLFEMANIRNQVSWVHSDDRNGATRKACDLVRMAVARAARLAPQHTIQVPVQHAALVVGGGAAGMTTALTLANQGFAVHLVEKESLLGGNLRRIHTSLPELDSNHPPLIPQVFLHQLEQAVLQNPLISLHLNSRVVAVRGFKGNFTSQLKDKDGSRIEIQHGVTILAIGAQEYHGPDYGYGLDPHTLTQQEFEQLLAQTSPEQLPGKVVMIQCIGPGEKFCSRICCTVALKNALALKQRKPDSQVVILYQDIRVYGFKERLYTATRQQGILFIRYTPDRRPEVRRLPNGALQAIHVLDPALGRTLELEPDLLVLSMPVVPQEEAHELATLFKVPQDAEGFFQEAHVKLRPVDFAADGIYMAGLAHYPKLLEESLVQAQAAASRAARILCRETLPAGGRVAIVDAERCTGCLTCVRLCPFNVPVIRADLGGVGGISGAAYIEPAVCQGCGICAAECPARAIQVMHYTDDQVEAKVTALLHPAVTLLPLESIALIE